MPNYKFLKMLSFTLAMFLLSCSNNQIESNLESPTPNDYSSSILLERLTSLNDSLLKVTPATRGVYERGCIIVGDIAGAISLAKAGFWAGGLVGPQTAIGVGFLGGLIGGVSGSYVAFRAAYGKTRGIEDSEISPAPMKVIAAYASVLDSDLDIDKYKPKTVNVNYPIKDENIILMGARHNVILQSLLDNKIDYKATKHYFTEQELEILNSKPYTQVYDSIMNQIEISGGLSITGHDVSSRLINLFNQVVAQYPQNGKDMEFLINKYIEAVNISDEVSDDEKKIIYLTLSVAASSFEYWKKQFNY